jgi:hypothetical protein
VVSELVLVGDAPFDRVGGRVSPAARALALAIVSWLPIALLGARADVTLGVWSDAALWARSWIAVPVLIVTERLIDRRLRASSGEFEHSRLVAPADGERFARIVERQRQLARSAVVEAALLVLAYAFAFWRTTHHDVLPFATWERPGMPSYDALSPAGWWYALVSLPLFGFLVLRWLWRIVLWIGFLARVSRLALTLSPLHPDRAGGLGFLSQAQTALAAVMLPLAAVWAGNWRNQLVHKLAPLRTLKISLAVLMALEVALFIGPLLLFTGPLIKLRQRGILELGGLGTRYARGFEHKWLRGEPVETVLGTPDLQSLADFGNVFERVVKIRPLPIERALVAMLLLVILFPVLPLLGSLVPLGPLLKHVLDAFM